MPENQNFDKQRELTLSQNDLSIKGNIDENIKELVASINSSTLFYTTSSCSGRISIAKNSSQKIGKLLETFHNPTPFPSIVASIDENIESLLSFEPFIVHVQCRELKVASKLLKISVNFGLKNSGLSIGKGNRFNVAIRNTGYTQLPINFEEGLTKKYLEYVINILNTKLENNNIKLQKFTSLIKEFISNVDSFVLEDGEDTRYSVL